MSESAWRDESTLRRLHYDEGLTKREIAERVGCSQFTLNKWWQRFDIETVDNYNDYPTGADHPSWKDKVLQRYCAYFTKQAKAARERDGYCCQWCGTRQPTHMEEHGRKLEVHHIKPVNEFREGKEFDRRKAHSLDNLASLCIPCHRAVERLEEWQVREVLSF